MKAGPRGISLADQQLWAAYAGTVSPLPGKTRPAPPPASSVPAPPESAGAPAAPRPKIQADAQPSLHPGITPAGLDKASWRKFSTSKTRATRRLDLHGHTAARAHHAVTRFVETAHAEQTRCIEIITGKGDILARELPHWLNHPSLRPLILAVAHPHAGNTGSLRILLRRAR